MIAKPVPVPLMLSSTIDFASMRDPHYHERILQHFVHDPVVTATHSVKPAQVSLQHTPCQRLLSQTIDDPDNEFPIRLWNPRQLSGRAALNPDRLVHVLLGPSRVPDRLGREALPGLH